MSSRQATSIAEVNGPTKTPDDQPSGWSRLWSSAQLLGSIAIATAALLYLLWGPSTRHAADAKPQERRETQFDAVKVVGPGKLRIQPGSSLEKNLQKVKVVTRRVSAPIMTVTGTVAASLRPGTEKSNDYWQFNAPDVLSAYSDWQKAQADVKFNVGQLASIKELAA